MTKLVLAHLAVWFIGFNPKTGQQSKSGIKHFFAFFLACLTLNALLVAFVFLAPIKRVPVHVQIRSNVDVRDIVAAINSLHRQDVGVKTVKDPLSSWPSLLFEGALGFMFLTSVIMALYQLLCRWLRIPPVI